MGCSGIIIHIILQLLPSKVKYEEAESYAEQKVSVESNH